VRYRVDSRRQHEKLIAGYSCNRIALARRARDAIRDFHEKVIASAMAAGVVPELPSSIPWRARRARCPCPREQLQILGRRRGYAADLAARLDGTLTGVYVYPSPLQRMPPYGSADLLEAIVENARQVEEMAHRSEEAFVSWVRSIVAREA